MALEVIVPGVLWHAQQLLKFGPFALTTRMTIVRLRDGFLWIHSSKSPTRELVDQLRKTGIVRYVVAPNKSHNL